MLAHLSPYTRTLFLHNAAYAKYKCKNTQVFYQGDYCLESEVKYLDSKALIIASCWFSVTIIAAVYMWVFADKIADGFGVLLPVGALVLIAFIVTFGLVFGAPSKPENKS